MQIPVAHAARWCEPPSSADGGGERLEEAVPMPDGEPSRHRPQLDELPKRFGGIEDAGAFCVRFFEWYHNRAGSAVIWANPHRTQLRIGH